MSETLKDVRRFVSRGRRAQAAVDRELRRLAQRQEGEKAAGRRGQRRSHDNGERAPRRRGRIDRGGVSDLKDWENPEVRAHLYRSLDAMASFHVRVPRTLKSSRRRTASSPRTRDLAGLAFFLNETWDAWIVPQILDGVAARSILDALARELKGTAWEID
jgi:hypothetical protein